MPSPGFEPESPPISKPPGHSFDRGVKQSETPLDCTGFKPRLRFAKGRYDSPDYTTRAIFSELSYIT